MRIRIQDGIEGDVTITMLDMPADAAKGFIQMMELDMYKHLNVEIEDLRGVKEDGKSE